MQQTESKIDLKGVLVGDRVQGEFVITERIERTTTAGDPFLILKVGNSTGQIDCAPIWMEKLSWADGAEQGAIVQVVGDITSYERGGKTKKQITISAPLRVLPKDQYDPLQFLPSIGDTIKIWDWVDRQRAEIRSNTIRSIVDLFFADDNFRLQFEKTPGAPGGAHHSRLGGLLQHTYEVTSIAKTSARTMKANVDLTIAGALLHDIGKVEAYQIQDGGFTATIKGALLGHVVIGFQMLDRAVSSAKLAGKSICSDEELAEIQHIILSHHGSLEFGSPVQPMTLEAEIVHWADEMSAKANDVQESLADNENFGSGRSISDKRPWRTGKKLWRSTNNWNQD